MAKTGEDTYEVLDGQQRTISICQYVEGNFSVNIDGDAKYYHNLTETEKEKIDNYELSVWVVEGTEEEKLKWFRKINLVGEALTEQELLNAAYTGTWLADAKRYFSKTGCVAKSVSDGYMKGKPIRQEYLEKVLSWIADRDNLANGQMYMAIHQHDEDANDLWIYFQSVIDWAKRLFPKNRKINEKQDWGILYNKYHEKKYNANLLDADIEKLLLDEDVTNQTGIIPYVLSDRSRHDEKVLSIRAFTDGQKLRAFTRQNGVCPCCGRTCTFEEMQGDHIIAWSNGGRTVDDNLQMLCGQRNNEKRNK